MSENTIEIAVQDVGGKDVEKVSVELTAFDRCRRKKLLKDAVVSHLANRRVGTHDTRTRAQVKGSNKKPWRQKGTGRARAGTRKSPLWRGGGIIFGPHPRSYTVRMNRKQRRLALRSALFGKFKDGEVRLVDTLRVDAPKTRVVAKMLDDLKIEGSCLIGVAAADRNLYLSVRNLAGVKVLPVSDLNVYDVLLHRTLLLTREALDLLRAGDAETTPAAASAESDGGES